MSLPVLFPQPPVIPFAPAFSPALQGAGRSIPVWVWLAALGGLLIGWWLLQRRGVWNPDAADEAANTVSPLYRLDDLKVIHGIGAEEERVLREHAVKTYYQLAVSDPIFLHRVFEEAGLDGREPESWIAQARLAAAHDWAGLAAYASEPRRAAEASHD